ncbi:MAG TPA: patatin-like phospholipase family protein [Spirochaetales bacterium]|nr:patatin-like phospholipase family protein [Spirochaetales bacterium]
MPVYKNLAFKGGGVRGIAYLGAMDYFFNQGYMKPVERVAGTSAGAITACLLSLNFEDFASLKAVAETLEYTKVPARKTFQKLQKDAEDELNNIEEDFSEVVAVREAAVPQAQIQSQSQSQSHSDTQNGALSQTYNHIQDRLHLALNGERKLPKVIFKQVKEVSNSLTNNLRSVTRFFHDKGWYSSDYLYEWLRTNIADQFTVAKEIYTFADFQNTSIHVGNRKFLDLYITGTDITNRTSRIFSYETTPDMEVALAVRISMSIPLFFEAITYQYPGTDSPQTYVDGGMMLNYPVGIFDDLKYCHKLQRGINPETLGFFLYSSPEETKYKDISNIIDYGDAIFDTLLTVQEQLIVGSEKNKGRTIFIDDKGISYDDFAIRVGDEKYRMLYESGYGATEAFFTNRSNWEQLVSQVQLRFGWRGMGN